MEDTEDGERPHQTRGKDEDSFGGGNAGGGTVRCREEKNPILSVSNADLEKRGA